MRPHLHSAVPFAFAALMFAAGVLRAQTASVPAEPYESDVMIARPVRYFIAPVLGGYMYRHIGSFTPNCDCSFRDAEGVRFIPGLAAVIQYPKLGFALSVTVMYHDYSATFSFEEPRVSTFIGNVPDSLVQYKKTSVVSHRSIRLVPAIQWYFPYTAVFLHAGLDIGIPLRARYDNTEQILTPGTVYKNGSDRVVLLSETNIPGGRAVQFGLSLGVGGDVRLSNRFVLTPRFTAGLPISALSSADPSWKVLTLQGDMMLKVRL